MVVTRPPHPALRPHVRLLWAQGPSGDAPSASGREHVLPTGQMHLALRLSGPPLRVCESGGRSVEMSHAVIGGPRSRYYARETGGAGASVGVLFEPQACLALFAAPAGALAHRHTALQDLWPRNAGPVLERLQLADSPDACLDVLESELLGRFADGVPSAPPAVSLALEALHRGGSVADAVRRSGYSHRHLLTVFRECVGLAPKEYLLVRRMQLLLSRCAAAALPWAELAADVGFSDQAHLSRAFRDFAGVTPEQWRRAAPRHPNHMPVP